MLVGAVVTVVVMVELEREIFLTIVARSHYENNNNDDDDDDDEDDEEVAVVLDLSPTPGLPSPVVIVVVDDENRLPPRLTGVWLWLLFMRRTKPSTRSSTYSNGRNGWYRGRDLTPAAVVAAGEVVAVTAMSLPCNA